MNPRKSLGVLVAAAYANFSQLGARLVISPLIPLIILTFYVTKGSVGAVLTTMWAVFALQQYPGGVLSDAYGERRVILLALSVTSVASIGVALAPTFLILGLAALALGAGAGLYIPSAVALLDRLFDRNGQALGTHPRAPPAYPLTPGRRAARPRTGADRDPRSSPPRRPGRRRFARSTGASRHRGRPSQRRRWDGPPQRESPRHRSPRGVRELLGQERRDLALVALGVLALNLDQISDGRFQVVAVYGGHTVTSRESMARSDRMSLSTETPRPGPDTSI